MALRTLFDVPAPAKLNLFLHVVGRRPDGYHLLQSVFVLVDWCDTLHFEVRPDGGLARHDLGPALPEDDLCLRAARALQARSSSPLGADISIAKHVPWGAGMGGGSSDAATTLLALNRLWGLNWPRRALLGIGLALGADVPFFLGGHNAFVEGIGEQLTPLRLPRQWLAVVKPAAGVATQAIFRSPLLARNTEPVILEGLIARDTGFVSPTANAAQGRVREREVDEVEAGDFGPLLAGFGRNDLQPPAQAECPEIARAASLLEAAFGNSRMTGSGSAVFARAGTGDQPVATLPAYVEAGWVGRMCRSLEFHPLAGWASD
jgi:4-diphosphocytidyl-2-C-methyl-D-erythritol kinase